MDTTVGAYCSYCTYWVEPSQVGTAVAQWLECCATNRKVLVRSQLVSLEFFIDIILPIAL
jgi:hypothetical protein